MSYSILLNMPGSHYKTFKILHDFEIILHHTYKENHTDFLLSNLKQRGKKGASQQDFIKIILPTGAMKALRHVIAQKMDVNKMTEVQHIAIVFGLLNSEIKKNQEHKRVDEVTSRTSRLHL